MGIPAEATTTSKTDFCSYLLDCRTLLMITRLFLLIVGLAYCGLCVWCSLAPERTSKSVGFTLSEGSGQSEFLVIYGGLELALGLLFLWPMVAHSSTTSVLACCLLIHGCLVLFRTLGFFLYSDFARITYSLAVGEWVIFLLALVLYWRTK